MHFWAWRYKSFHPSYGIGWMCCGLLVGVYGGQYVRLEVPLVLDLLFIIVIVALLAKLRWYVCVVVVLLSALIGLGRGSHYDDSLGPLRQRANTEIAVQGIVADDPQHTARGDTQLTITQVTINGIRYTGDIWVSSRNEHAISRGDSVTVRGKAHEGFGGYQLTMTYATVDSIRPSNDPVIALRDAFAKAVRAVIVEPSASLGIGFVVGQKSSLPTTLEDQLRVVGLTHMVVASGYNLTILVRFAKRLFEKRSKYLVAASSSFMILGFVALSGASPSMVRAGIVAGLSILAWYYGRRFHPLLLIVYVAALTAMINPLYVWADIGWWLSFLAFFGVLIISPLMLRMMYKRTDTTPPSIVQILVETIAAQVMTLPLILMTFGMMPVLSVFANLFSAPLVPFAMLLTFAAGMAYMIAPIIGAIIGIAAEVILSYFVAIVRMFAAPEWAQVPFAIEPYVMVMVYGGIVGVAFALWRKTKHNFRQVSSIE